MATIVLGAVGSAFFGPVGQFIGAALGAFIDQRLFGPSPPKFPTPDELRTSGRDEGAPKPWGIGSQVPLPMTVLWMGPPRQTPADTGKSPAPGATLVDIAWCANTTEVESFRKLWFGGELLYDADADITLTGDTVSATTYTQYTKPKQPSDPIEVLEEFMDLNSSALEVDLGRLRVGYDCEVSGFTNAVNNGTGDKFRVRQAWTNIDGTSFARLEFRSKSLGPAINEAAGDTLTLYQDIPEYNPARLGGLAFYLGTDDQLPSSIIEAVEGVGSVPGYRGKAYVVITDFNASKWGGTIPDGRCLLRERLELTLADAVTEVVARSTKLTAADIDVTALEDVEVLGLTSIGPIAPADLLTQLALVYNIDAQERDGKLVFFLQDEPDEVEVPYEDISVREPGQQVLADLRRTFKQAYQLPQQLDVGFLDPVRDWQVGTEPFRRVANPINSPSSVQLGLVLTRLEAAKVAKKLMVRLHVAAEEAETDLSAQYTHVSEGDNLLVEASDIGERRYRVTNCARGDNGVMRVELVREHLPTFEQEVVIEESTTKPLNGKVPLPTSLDTFILDLPPLFDQHTNSIGFYVALGTSDPFVPYSGGSVWRASTGSAAYTALLNVPTESLTGFVDGTLAGGVVPGLWDRKNTVDVILNDQSLTLESKPYDAVVAGANWIVIGPEIIAYTTATLIAPRTYRLSNLIRGLRGTERWIDEHRDNELVLPLGQSSMLFLDVGLAQLKVEADFKGVPLGALVEDVKLQVEATQGLTATPFPPSVVKGVRDSSNNLTVSWMLRTRRPYRVLSGTVPPTEESSERYEVVFLDTGTPVRTVFVTAATTTTYTAAQQTTDGLTPGDPVDVVIYQLGDLVGRGLPAQATI